MSFDCGDEYWNIRLLGEDEETKINKFLASLKIKAENGDPEAQHKLAYFYERGTHFKKDLKKSYSLYKKSAEQGHVVSQYQLANFYLEGEAVKQDFQKAYYWYSKAAGNHPHARYMRGYLLYTGKGIAQDYEAAYRDIDFPSIYVNFWSESLNYSLRNRPSDDNDLSKWFLDEARKGHPIAQFHIAQQYSQRSCSSEDVKESVKWSEKSAAQNYPIAQEFLGHHYFYGIGVTQSYDRAIKYYNNAALKGSFSAHSKLGHLYNYGQIIPKDIDLAIEHFKIAGENKDMIAQYNLEILLK